MKPTLVWGCSVRVRQRRLGTRTFSDLPKTELRILTMIPVVLQILVVASSSFGIDFVLWTLGAEPLSPEGRLVVEKVNIALMGLASLSTFVVGLELAFAIIRPVPRREDAPEETMQQYVVRLRLVASRRAEAQALEALPIAGRSPDQPPISEVASRFAARQRATDTTDHLARWKSTGSLGVSPIECWLTSCVAADELRKASEAQHVEGR